jgi:hypothetical protein
VAFVSGADGVAANALERDDALAGFNLFWRCVHHQEWLTGADYDTFDRRRLGAGD